MTARTIQTPAALRRDTRFQACSPGAKWVFGHLCDRREVVAEPGLDVLGTVALIVEGLGDTPREVLAPLLVELERDRGLVTMESARLVVHTLETAADRQGPRGGKSNATRQAEYRARRAPVTSPVTSRVTTQPVTVTDSVTSPNPLLDTESNGSNGASRNVTDEVTGSADSDGPGVPPSLSPSALPLVSPLTLPSLTLPPTPPLPSPSSTIASATPDPELAAKLLRLAALEAVEAERKRLETKSAERAAKRDAKAAKQVGVPTEDTIPLAGTLAHKVYLAIVGDPALQPITGNPGDFAARIADPAYCPGVDVLAAVRSGGEYVARHPGKYVDGRAFLSNQLRRLAAEEKLRPKAGSPMASGAFSVPRFSREAPPAAIPPPPVVKRGDLAVDRPAMRPGSPEAMAAADQLQVLRDQLRMGRAG